VSLQFGMPVPSFQGDRSQGVPAAHRSIESVCPGGLERTASLHCTITCRNRLTGREISCPPTLGRNRLLCSGRDQGAKRSGVAPARSASLSREAALAPEPNCLEGRILERDAPPVSSERRRLAAQFSSRPDKRRVPQQLLSCRFPLVAHGAVLFPGASGAYRLQAQPLLPKPRVTAC